MNYMNWGQLGWPDFIDAKGPACAVGPAADALWTEVTRLSSAI